MTILTIPLRNARTRWPRTLLLTLVFTLGVASISALALVSSVVGESFERKLVSFGANILVTPKRDSLSVSYGGIVLGDVAFAGDGLDLTAVEQAMSGMQYRANIAAVAPKLLAVRQLEGSPVPLVGVDWEMEMALKAYWEFSGELPQQAGSVLAGSALARNRNLSPGSRLEVDGKELQVTGVLLPTGSDDDNVLFLSLAEVQQLAGRPGRADLLEVAALCAGCPMEDIVDELALVLPFTEVKALRQVAESRMYAVHFARDLALAVSLIILATACAMVGMSMYSSVAERKKEIGILRAVGFTRLAVFLVFVAEGAGIGLASGLAGAVSGHFLAGSVLANLHLDQASLPPFSFTLTILITLGVALLAVSSAVLPACKASRVEPGDALVSL